MKTTRFLPLLLCSLGLTCGAAEQTQDDKMRLALRDALLQLRTAQAEAANAQASLAQVNQEKKDLEAKYEAVKKQAAVDRAASDKALAGLNAQIAALKSQVGTLSTGLETSKSEGEKLQQLWKTTEEKRVQLEDALAELQNRLKDREAKNLSLFVLGNEILTRYEEFSFGEALKAKEPFVGRTRARLETLLQDYKDRLQDQRVKP